MILHRERAICLLETVRIDRAGHAEHFVIVAFCHPPPLPQARTGGPRPTIRLTRRAAGPSRPALRECFASRRRYFLSLSLSSTSSKSASTTLSPSGFCVPASRSEEHTSELQSLMRI